MKFIPGTALATVLSLLTSAPLARAGNELFRDKVAPVLEGRCLRCHGENSPKGRLKLTTLTNLLEGGESGPALVPGKPSDSLLLEKITGDPPEMPLKEKPLAAEEVAAIRAWIETGADWPQQIV